jgi:hypothetical protein
MGTQRYCIDCAFLSNQSREKVSIDERLIVKSRDFNLTSGGLLLCYHGYLSEMPNTIARMWTEGTDSKMELGRLRNKMSDYFLKKVCPISNWQLFSPKWEQFDGILTPKEYLDRFSRKTNLWKWWFGVFLLIATIVVSIVFS